MAERALFELSDAKRLPHLLAELRRFGRADAEWYIDSDGVAWVFGELVNPSESALRAPTVVAPPPAVSLSLTGRIWTMSFSTRARVYVSTCSEQPFSSAAF